MVTPFEAIATKVAASILGAGAQALVKGRLTTFFDDRKRLKALEAAIAASLTDFREEYRDLANSFFDEAFLSGPAADEIRKLLELTETPSAENLAEAYKMQFSQPAPSVIEPCRAFLSNLESRLNSSRDLSELFAGRAVRRTDAMVREIHSAITQKNDSEQNSKATNDILQRGFNLASADVANWPKALPGGHVFNRPELAALAKNLAQNKFGIFALLGAPGAGKSAFLSALIPIANDLGFTSIAIKADTIPLHIATEQQLQSFLGLPISPAAAIRQISQTGPVLLLIDQMDALCRLVDTKSQRLTVLLRLIREVAALDNVAIVYSCREFEHEYDARFSTLEATEIKLELPSWENVSRALIDTSIDSEVLPKELKEVLRVPQHLSVFLRLAMRGLIGAIATYQGMLEQFWKAHLDAPNSPLKRQILVELADAMQSEEELWSPRAKWVSHTNIVDELISDGFLIESHDGFKIGFTHQTLADFAKIRSFLEANQSAANYTIGNAERLSVRPVVWGALHYLRQASISIYRRELGTLWSHDALPDHLRLLLIEFVGSQASPDAEEIRLFSRLIHSADPVPFIISCRHSAGWFQYIANTQLTQWMEEPDKFHFATTVLVGALKHSQNDALSFLDREWLTHKRAEESTATVLFNIEDWNEGALDLAVRYTELFCSVRFEIRSSFERALKLIGAPAYRLLRSFLNAQLQKAREEVERINSSVQSSSPSHPLIRLIEKEDVWHFLNGVEANTPIEFLSVGLPWLEQAAGLVRWQDNGSRDQYAADGISRWIFDDGNDDEDGRPTRPLDRIFCTFEAAAGNAAQKFPQEFKKLVEQYSGSDLAVIHAILMAGLEKLDETSVEFSINYLMVDVRRFYVGTLANPQCRTEKLLDSLAPKLTVESAERLESSIRGWRGPFRASTESEATWRRETNRLNALARLRLLQCLPESRLSEKSIRFIREEERRLPPSVVRLPSSGIRSGWVKSPLSLQKLQSATAGQILKLLHRVPDGVERYKSGDFIGGNRELSREIAELAKSNPRKAIEIVEGCDPDKFQRLAELVFEALCIGSESIRIPDSEILSLFANWIKRGYGGPRHRDQFAWGLEKVAHRNGGLPTEICNVLEDWLETEPIPENFGSIEMEAKEWDCLHPVVFGSNSGPEIVPHGTFPILSALVDGYLCRKPQAELDALRAVLSRQHKRESDLFWNMTLWSCRSLLAKHHKESASLVVDLLRSRPQLRTSMCSLYAVWCALGSHKEKEFFDIIDILLSEVSARSRQGAGELLFAFVAHCGSTEDADRRMRQISQLPPTDPVRLGIIHSAVIGWRYPEVRAAATEVILGALKSGEELVTSIALGVFRRGNDMPRNVETRSLIVQAKAAVQYTPGKAIAQVLDALPNLFLNYPEEVIGYLEAVLPTIEQEIADMKTHLALHAEALVEIAIAAHKTPGYESRGLRIFERLLKRQVYKTREAITAIDRWRPV